jgi:hypothetical protein
MSGNVAEIRENIENIRKRVAEAAVRSGRKPEDIKIIAVTKTIDAERVRQAVECGLTELGENRVQELCDKYELIDRKCSWHLIGHLQTNKVKYIVDKVSLIHSLDRLELAKELQNRAQKQGRILEALIQVNIAEEESKFGMRKELVPDFIKTMAGYSNLKVKGLMTIAPLAENPEDIRWVFREAKKLLIDIKAENIDNIDMDYLSMGMSGDFEIAVEEGSTLLRIGTAIFGERR